MSYYILSIDPDKLGTYVTEIPFDGCKCIRVECTQDEMVVYSSNKPDLSSVYENKVTFHRVVWTPGTRQSKHIRAHITMMGVIIRCNDQYNVECPCCLESCTDMRFQGCQIHSLCMNCNEEWAIKRRKKCPLCRI